jgi:hypothetical protein
MTVSNEVNKSGPYPGNGSAVTFNYGFRIVDETHLKVIRAEAGIETVLTLATDYTVSGVGDAGGGSITTVVAPTASQTITLVPDVPFTQELDLENQGGYYAEDVERGFDLAAIRDQQLQEQVDRSVKIPSSYDNDDLDDLVVNIIRLGDSADQVDTVAGISADVTTVAGVSADVTTVADNIASVSNVSDNIASVVAVNDNMDDVNDLAANITPLLAAAVTTTNKAAEAAGYLEDYKGSWLGVQAADPTTDLNGDPLTGGELYFNSVALVAKVYDLGTDIWYQVGQPTSPVSNGYVGNGSTANFTLSIAPANKNLTLVYIDGVYQNKDQYSVAGTTLTFTSAPASSAKVEVITLVATDIGTPSNNTVGPDQLNDAEKPEIRGFLELDLLRGDDAIINGNFDFWQYATSQTSSGYGSADRWVCAHSGSTKTASQQAFTPGQTDVPGEPEFFMRHVIATGGGASDRAYLFQRIEGVRTYAGETATLTFYAKADSAKDIAVEILQSFGSGGAPSAVETPEVRTITLSSTWQKFSYTIAINAITGKTIGTDNNDRLEVNFWFDAGSDWDARSNSLGNQSGTFDIARVSLVRGDATDEKDPAARRQKQQVLEACQRYFEKSYLLSVAPGTGTVIGAEAMRSSAAAGLFKNVTFKTRKRAIPTVTDYSSTTGASGKVRDGSSSVDLNSVQTGVSEVGYIQDAVVGAAGRSIAWQWTASAEL